MGGAGRPPRGRTPTSIYIYIYIIYIPTICMPFLKMSYIKIKQKFIHKILVIFRLFTSNKGN